MDIRDKVVVVTGGASGIGKALAARFVAEGAAHVAIADVNAEGVVAAAAELGGIGEVLDVSDPGELEKFIDHVEAKAGPIDLFCSNAGIGTGMGIDASDEAWATIWGVNL
ncbi:MAG: SDR family NAD(P)-dependent oxidoreductase, partial [Acidimicrobiales bacterium]